MMIGIICAVCLPFVLFARIKKGEIVDLGASH
jgi:hypothetical protein